VHAATRQSHRGVADSELWVGEWIRVNVWGWVCDSCVNVGVDIHIRNTLSRPLSLSHSRSFARALPLPPPPQLTQFAKSRGLPVFKHVLVPRMKGLLATLGEHDNTLRNSADAVIDCTFGYPLRRSGGAFVYAFIVMFYIVRV